MASRGAAQVIVHAQAFGEGGDGAVAASMLQPVDPNSGPRPEIGKSPCQVLKRINLLIQDTLRNPTEGIGKPEALRQALAGYWSRRITDEHRFVHRVVGNELRIAQLRDHYEK